MNRKKRSDAKFGIGTTSLIPPGLSIYKKYLYIFTYAHILIEELAADYAFKTTIVCIFNLCPCKYKWEVTKLIDSGEANFWIYMHMIKRHTTSSITTN